MRKSERLVDLRTVQTSQDGFTWFSAGRSEKKRELYSTSLAQKVLFLGIVIADHFFSVSVRIAFFASIHTALSCMHCACACDWFVILWYILRIANVSSEFSHGLFCCQGFQLVVRAVMSDSESEASSPGSAEAEESHEQNAADSESSDDEIIGQRPEKRRHVESELLQLIPRISIVVLSFRCGGHEKTHAQ